MSPPLRILMLTLCAAGCGPVELDLPLERRTPSECTPESCSGCCLGDTCVKAAGGCGGGACFACLGGETDAPLPTTAATTGACGMACSGRHACMDGACVREMGRTCTPGEVCAPGSSCRAVDGYHTMRCWPDCASGVCPSGMACEMAQSGRPTCVPEPGHANARYELRQLAFVDPQAAAYGQTPWKAPNYRQCYDGAAITSPTGVTSSYRHDLCLPTRVGSPAPEFRHRLTASELARLKVEVWRVDEAQAVPGCELGQCKDFDHHHLELAAQSPREPDLRPAEGLRAQTFSPPLVDSANEASHLQLHVLVEQVR